MQIISSSYNIKGVVKCVNAFELPPTVIMEFIPGFSLEQAIEGNILDRWHGGLHIGREIVRIVRACHQLPEHVLHRDIRPANIILSPNDLEFGYDVMVLDFDLSWHRGATPTPSIEPDKSYGSALAYLAPEQLYRELGVSTRSTSVDAYGFGMTLYFIFSRRHPTHHEKAILEWARSVRHDFVCGVQPQWKSLPVRLARLVVGATRWEQSHRLDMSQIEKELTILSQALFSLDKTFSAQLWAEELMCRAFGQEDYEWDDLHYSARKTLASGSIPTDGSHSLAESNHQIIGLVDRTIARLGFKRVIRSTSGVEISCIGDELAKDVNLTVQRLGRGGVAWKDIRKFLPKAKDKVCSTLKQCAFRVKTGTVAGDTVRIEAVIDIESLRRSFDEAVRAVAEIGGMMEFR